MTETVFQLTSAMSVRISRITAKGCRIGVTHEFSEVGAALREAGKPYLTPTLSPGWNDFTRENCFWIHISMGGELLGAAGVKRESIGVEPVGEYWRRIHRRHYPRPDGGEVIEEVSSLIGDSFQGDIAYFGDLFLNPKLRKLQVIEDFGHVALYHAAISFRASVFYAFLKDRDLRRGFGYQLGLMRCVPRAQIWADPAPATRGNHEACCYSTANDVLGLAALDVADA
ncbi:hypothetical protein VWZ88_01735 [Phaeobacter sp. JH20_36]|uniref:hypothetical protein n=1 Tax=unclassified Phaeobacter TaxID=2621772 RepID=UPI003A8B8638